METMMAVEEQSDVLNTSDRCDRCGAQAYVYTEGVSGSLLWCRHHYLKHQDAIASWAFETIDETNKL
jgi:hypothetical protein